ncbi:LytR/AlgR family response regulator transcription factor [Parapedobacter sp. 10938]|uniref:LytR/AlgR family response regulator transcription factor n=1 Tax=Parapedobacter flavus TaxID=3110225 RepID=UPI002DBC185D|nr:LytTR family DNA-binding domain-containing protein [Parapedobacter sp. 10938]MEC3878625.1 LytTR family DNA-binding domain-containing protein [Parapedobacter sp. 10938]
MYNCIIIEDDGLAREALAAHIDRIPFLKLVGAYESPLALKGASDRIDLVFSDIHMPELDGISYLKSLINPPLFIFVTGNANYGAESYDLDVLDFVVKPFDFERIMKAANKAKAVLDLKHGATKSPDYLIVKDRSKYIIVPYNEICFIQAQKDYVTIETTEGTYTLWGMLGDVGKELPTDCFLRVHKSYIVNVEFVKSISAKKIVMKGNLREIPIGDTFKNELRRHFGID